MPRVNIQMLARDLETKRRLVERITEAVVETCQVTPDNVTVVLTEMAEENFAKAGVLRCDAPK